MPFELTQTTFDPAPLRDALLDREAGGFCSFEGWVRRVHLGREVISLVYESYPELARQQGYAVMQSALERFDIIEARAVHRTGRLVPGDLAVWIGVTAAHRAAAFDACRYLIDTIKATVPIWKHEFYADGTDVWVDPSECGCARGKEFPL